MYNCKGFCSVCAFVCVCLLFCMTVFASHREQKKEKDRHPIIFMKIPLVFRYCSLIYPLNTWNNDFFSLPKITHAQIQFLCDYQFYIIIWKANHSLLNFVTFLEKNLQVVFVSQTVQTIFCNNKVEKKTFSLNCIRILVRSLSRVCVLIDI